MIPPNNVQYLRSAKCLKVLQSEERNERADVLGKPGCGVQFRVGLAVTPRHDRYNHRLQTFTWRIFCWGSEDKERKGNKSTPLSLTWYHPFVLNILSFVVNACIYSFSWRQIWTVILLLAFSYQSIARCDSTSAYCQMLSIALACKPTESWLNLPSTTAGCTNFTLKYVYLPLLSSAHQTHNTRAHSLRNIVTESQQI